jgi:hypothetical protein
MEGAPVGPFDPRALPLADDDPEGWTPALVTPPLPPEAASAPLTLPDSTGVVYTRRR